MCANFCLNAHTLCAKLGLNAQSLGDSKILGKAQSSTYFYCGLLRDLTVGILRYGGVVCGWPVPCHMLCATHCSLATCSGYRGRRPCVRIWGVTGLGKWLHLFSCRIFFSRIYVLHPDPALTPWEAKSKCKSAIFCRMFPSALGSTCPAMTTDQCRGETGVTAKVVNLSPKYHGSVTSRFFSAAASC